MDPYTDQQPRSLAAGPLPSPLHPQGAWKVTIRRVTHARHDPAGELVGATTREPRRRPLLGRRGRWRTFLICLGPENARGFSAGVFDDLKKRSSQITGCRQTLHARLIIKCSGERALGGKSQKSKNVFGSMFVDFLCASMLVVFLGA